MKLILLLFVVLVVLVMAVPLLKGLGEIAERQTEAPSVTERQLGPEIDSVTQPETDDTSGSMYRWRAADGTVHIESSPPPDGTPFETIHFARPVEEEGASAPVADTATPEPGPGAPPALQSPLDVYTPEGMRELVEQVDRTATQLEQRDSLMQELGEQL